MDENFVNLLPYIEASITEGNNDMILYSLMILRYVFINTDPLQLSASTQDHSTRLAEFLSKCLDQSPVKILSETLTVCGSFFIQLRDVAGNFDQKHLPAIHLLQKAILDKLNKADIDQLVK